MYMKKAFIIFTCCILATGCCKYIITGDYSLRDVECSIGADGGCAAVNGTYSDELVSITPVMESGCFSMNIINLSSKPIKIDWNSAAYTDETESSYLIFTDSELNHRKHTQLAGIVPAQSGSHFRLYPATLTKDNLYGRVTGFIRMNTEYSDRDEAENHLCKPVRLTIPIECKGTAREYTFSFASDNARIWKIHPVFAE